MLASTPAIRPAQHSTCPVWIAIALLLIGPASLPAFELAASHPGPNAEGVSVSASLHLRFSDAVAPQSIKHISLVDIDADALIHIRRSTDLTNASITLSPVEFLRSKTRYEIRGSRSVRSANGEPLTPFRIRFSTGAAQFDVGNRLHFEPRVFDQTRSMTTVLRGPDRRLYAASAFGELVRWDLDESGEPVRKTVIDQDEDRSRQYIDLEWDPAASPSNLVLWASYAERIAEPDDPRKFFTGTIARLKLSGDVIERSDVIVTGLPHGREKQGGHETLPHQPNGLCFFRGKLYQSVGSTSSSGGPANWGIHEQPLSAAILEIDYQQIVEPVDVFPQTGFDPSDENAVVKVFATGVRNALEIIAHSNGRLYTAVNINDRAKPMDGVPDAPGIPGNQNLLVKKTTPDHESLYILERDRHYGFPNPARDQFVLNGGNPTDAVDPYEIDDYPIGTPPDDGFAPELMYPLWRWGGTSPNGMIEYHPIVAHPLRHTLMCCFYSAGDIAVLTLGSDGLPVSVEKLRSPTGKLVFNGPLDLTQDRRTGILYVADFGTQNKFGSNGSMVMLTPMAGR